MTDRFSETETRIRATVYADLPECGHRPAVPNCQGRRCRLVYDEWTLDAIGFQRMLESGHLDRLLGIKGRITTDD